MGMKMKNTWVKLLLIIGVVAVIFIVLNQLKGKDREVPPKGTVYEEEIITIPDITSVSEEEIESEEANTSLKSKEPISDYSTAISSDASERPFAIQVGSFRDKSRAESVAVKLREQDYPAHIATKDLGQRGVWYRVWVGKFETKEEAAQILEKIRQNYKDSFIISR